MACSQTVGIRVLYSTRWTVRADSLFSVVENYTILMNTWDEATRVIRDMETKARILGVQSQMQKFSFMFGVYLGEMILKHSDNLSKTLQSNTICAAEGQNVAGMVIRTLEKLRSSEALDFFWQKVTDSSETHGVGEPDLPRPHKMPKRYEDGNAMCEIHNELKTYYRQQY